MIKSSHLCRTPEHNILGQFWRSNFKVILRICFFQTYFWRSSPVFHTDFWWVRTDQNSRREIGIVLKVKMSMSFFKYTLFTHIFEGSLSAIHRYFLGNENWCMTTLMVTLVRSALVEPGCIPSQDCQETGQPYTWSKYLVCFMVGVCSYIMYNCQIIIITDIFSST